MRVRARRNLTYNHTYYPEGFVFDLVKDSDFKAYRDGYRKEEVIDEVTGQVKWKDTDEILVQGAMVQVDDDTPLGQTIEQGEEFDSQLQGRKIFASSADVFAAKEAEDRKKLEAKKVKTAQQLPAQSPELASAIASTTSAPAAEIPAETQVPSGPKPGRKKKMAEV